MLKRLQHKWGVGGWKLVLILMSFATGGSLTGYAGRKLMGLTGIESTALYILIYGIVITVLWPLMVLLASIPFGQFAFFKKYIGKIGNRITGRGSRAEARKKKTKSEKQ